MFPAVALLVATLGVAWADEGPEHDPVLVVGARGGGSAGTVDGGSVGVHATVQASLELPFDRRTSGRFELGGNPVRGRIHAAFAGRTYPLVKGRASWWAELSAHVQHTGARTDPTRWAPWPSRTWVSLPFLYGAGWRFMTEGGVVLDVGVHVGPMLELRPQSFPPLGFGVVGTGHVLIGAAL